MLTVTATAKKKLEEALQGKPGESQVTFRLVVSSSRPTRIAITLDKEKEGDQVVRNEEGVKLLLIGPDVVSELEGLVFDYKPGPRGAAFTLSKSASLFGLH
ncbi:MAG: hypothetical protein ACE5JU_02110 [Candidatus Binatia bacterium]